MSSCTTNCGYHTRDILDMEDINAKYDALIAQTFQQPTDDDVLKYGDLVRDILAMETTRFTKSQINKAVNDLKKRYKCNHKNSFIMQIYRKMIAKKTEKLDDCDVCDEDCVTMENRLREYLKIKSCKSHSGVLVITIFTSPYPQYTDHETGEQKTQPFSCAWNCAYCPNEPGQPRSYIKGEPGVMRANKNKFDCKAQMWDRMTTLYNIGHPVDKLEVIVLGGTWTSYPLQYREEFIRDMYYAANEFWTASHIRRPPSSLEQEKHINRAAQVRVIGLTLETRPDTLCNDPTEIKLLRSYGCTRVQLGIQHIDDTILDRIDRKHLRSHAERAIRILKDCGFKVDSHWMPNLPFSDPQKDRHMLIDVLLGTKTPVPKRYIHPRTGIEWEEWTLTEPDLQTDQWKVYPCAITPYTLIEQWYKQGTYVPYSETDLLDILTDMSALMFPWIRVNRIIRDIPTDYIMASSESKSNLRQQVEDTVRARGLYCMCIRCREVKMQDWDGLTYVTRARSYNASGAQEIFLSAESADQRTLYGFLRLRLAQKNNAAHAIFPELTNCALIRELHVYGKLTQTSDTTQHVQHKGIGKHLVHLAEIIARDNAYYKISVIAGEGTKMYYHKLGYGFNNADGGFMIKTIALL